MKILLSLILGFLIGFGVFALTDKDNNSSLRYGDTGFPKNCRAIIKENIDGFVSGEYNAEAVLNSINRNCGEFGYSWGE